ncbi:Rrf2 family transcriptional regulator [Candidatus Uhrbacteria bacterium]|nr:Rrf2 family transcriptional regulator [Candidatus Uhrbacteria bacterium]
MSGFFHIQAREHGALLLLEEIAQASGARLSLQTIAEKTGISLAYMEEIAASLKQAGLIRGKQGPGGGYVLAHDPKDISIEAMLIAVSGPLNLVDCQSNMYCPREQVCASKHIWSKVQDSLTKTLRNLSLADMLTK